MTHSWQADLADLSGDDSDAADDDAGGNDGNYGQGLASDRHDPADGAAAPDTCTGMDGREVRGSNLGGNHPENFAGMDASDDKPSSSAGRGSGLPLKRARVSEEGRRGEGGTLLYDLPEEILILVRPLRCSTWLPFPPNW
jgi:hypothetical protein